ncbi:MAG: ABC transporter ATP-binding protein [Actinobacteria bacterium]|nr:ABC transporter ATP-binding protein [Actinomycetota bacterium]
MLSLENLSVAYEGKAALDRVTLEVAEGEVVTVLGPSGSGKSTLLRVVAGLQRPDSGRVLLDGEDLSSVPAHRRGIGLVFQDHALFHHRDVWGNVAFGLRMRGDPRQSIERRVRACLELVGLGAYERRSVVTLSGGEQQRVALARALAPEPRVILLDEPLGSLDRRLRERLLEDLTEIFDRLRVTAVHVTHDRAEAFALGDRVAVMRAGQIVQVGTPDGLWAGPTDRDTARFLGLNVVGGRAIRPEAVAVLPVAGQRGEGVVERAVRQGPTVRLTVQLDGGGILDAVVAALDHPEPGDRVRIEIDAAGVTELPENVADGKVQPDSA